MRENFKYMMAQEAKKPSNKLGVCSPSSNQQMLWQNPSQ